MHRFAIISNFTLLDEMYDILLEVGDNIEKSDLENWLSVKNIDKLETDIKINSKLRSIIESSNTPYSSINKERNRILQKILLERYHESILLLNRTISTSLYNIN
jgi:hypothetical protein